MLDKIDAGKDIKNYNATVRVSDTLYIYETGEYEDFPVLPDYSGRFLTPNYYNGCGPDCTGEA